MTPFSSRGTERDLADESMSALELAHLIRRIANANSIPNLKDLEIEIIQLFPKDSATPRLTGVIEVKLTRLFLWN